MAAEILLRHEMIEMRKMKRQFAKEMKAMIEVEVIRERERLAKEEKIRRHKKKVEKIE
jgi:hypothetical protein